MILFVKKFKVYLLSAKYKDDKTGCFTEGKKTQEHFNVNASQKQQIECRTLKCEMKITQKTNNYTEKPTYTWNKSKILAIHKNWSKKGKESMDVFACQFVCKRVISHLNTIWHLFPSKGELRNDSYTQMRTRGAARVKPWC